MHKILNINMINDRGYYEFKYFNMEYFITLSLEYERSYVEINFETETVSGFLEKNFCERYITDFLNPKCQDVFRSINLYKAYDVEDREDPNLSMLNDQ